MTTRNAFWAIALLAVVAIARVLEVWGELPRTMASHFGPSGKADGFMAREGFFVFMGVIWLLAALLPSLLVRFLPTTIINMPNRDYWLKPERREQTLRQLSDWLAWFSAGTSAFVLFALELTLQANLAQRELDNVSFLVGLALYFAFTGWMLVRLNRQFRLPSGQR